MPPIPWRVQTTNHPRSTRDEIEKEPDWNSEHAHEHRIGYRNRYNCRPGLTHEQDEYTEAQDVEEALDGYEKLKEEANAGDLLNFRDIVSE